MPSRQTVLNRVRDVARLRALIPEGCPLTVEYRTDDGVGGGFEVFEHGERRVTGRYEVVTAFLRGYVIGWQERVLTDTLPGVRH